MITIMIDLYETSMGKGWQFEDKATLWGSVSDDGRPVLVMKNQAKHLVVAVDLRELKCAVLAIEEEARQVEKARAKRCEKT